MKIIVATWNPCLQTHIAQPITDEQRNGKRLAEYGADSGSCTMCAAIPSESDIVYDDTPLTC